MVNHITLLDYKKYKSLYYKNFYLGASINLKESFCK